MKICILGAGTAGLIAALMLREKYPLYNITVIKSGDLGIVGVGEGSTEHWDKFIKFVNIPIEDLFYNTGCTIKIGILFKDWNIGEEYVHTVENPPFSKYSTPDLYNRLLQVNEKAKFPLSPLFENNFYKNRIPLTDNLKVSNQYHFDTFKLNDYFLRLCLERNIRIEDDLILDAALCPTTGNIKKLEGKKTSYSADFFIDCSGFKRVLAKKLGNEWVSMKRYLPMNHAIAFPTDFKPDQDIEPYTTCKALSSGWTWKIPTQTRYGNGYVFSDEYINSDQALAEINTSLNTNIEKVARDIKFEAGKVDQFWSKNVLSVGLCGSFAEPLEAQSIGFTIQQMFCFIEYFDTASYYEKCNLKYNEEMDQVFFNTVSFLQLHYIVRRNDSKFWNDKPFELTDFNKETIGVFEKGLLTPRLFNQSPFCLFWASNWYQVLSGLGLINKSFIFDMNRKDRYLKSHDEECIKNAEQITKATKFRMTTSHREFIESCKAFYLRKNEN